MRVFLRDLRGWNVRYGLLWMLQWQLAGWVSLGIHLELATRRASGGPFEGLSYGPYLDLHLGVVIVSVGWRPFLSGEVWTLSGAARGGVNAEG
jgi:hypothetical protein